MTNGASGLCAAALMAALGGCDDGGGAVDLSGIYTITEHLEDSAGCGPGSPSTTGTHFRMRKGDFVGASFWQVDLCTAAERSTCTQAAGGAGMLDSIPGGHQGEIGVATGGGASEPCSLNVSWARAIRSGDVITWESKLYNTVIADLPTAQCNGTEATARLRAGTLPCIQYKKLVGTKEIDDDPSVKVN